LARFETNRFQQSSCCTNSTATSVSSRFCFSLRLQSPSSVRCQGRAWIENFGPVVNTSRHMGFDIGCLPTWHHLHESKFESLLSWFSRNHLSDVDKRAGPVHVYAGCINVTRSAGRICLISGSIYHQNVATKLACQISGGASASLRSCISGRSRETI
jgi:hypothetical protein